MRLFISALLLSFCAITTAFAASLCPSPSQIQYTDGSMACSTTASGWTCQEGNTYPIKGDSKPYFIGAEWTGNLSVSPDGNNKLLCKYAISGLIHGMPANVTLFVLTNDKTYGQQYAKKSYWDQGQWIFYDGNSPVGGGYSADCLSKQSGISPIPSRQLSACPLPN